MHELKGDATSNPRAEENNANAAEVIIKITQLLEAIVAELRGVIPV